MAAGKLKLDIDTGKALASITRLESLFKKIDASLNKLNTTLAIFSTVLEKNNKGIITLSRGYTQFGRTLSNVRKEFTAATRVAERHNQKLAETRARMTSLMSATDSQTNSQNRNTTAKTRATAAQNTLTQTMQRARGVILAYVAALATGRLISFADATQRIDNRIKLALKPGQQFENLFRKVGKTAMDSRQPLEATATAFFRISQASKSLGISQDAALKATDLFNKLLTVQGVTSHEARSALLQYSQALQSGRFQGDEFRAISEILPQILDYLAAATGRTTAELRDLARQGQITPRVMLQALFDNAEDIEKQFKRTNVTLTQGFNILATSAHMAFSSIVKDALVLEAIGNTFKALHVVLITFLNAVGAALKVLGVVTHFFNEILAVTIIHFKTLIAFKLARIIRNIGVAFGFSARAVVAFNVAIRANPLFILISTIVLATIALRKYVIQVYDYFFAQEAANKETQKFNAMLSLFGDLLEAAGTEYGKWSKNLQQGAVAIGTSISQNVLKGIDDISAAFARSVVAGENFNTSMKNIVNLMKIAIAEAVAQTVVQVVIKYLLSLIKIVAEAILGLRQNTLIEEVKIAIENAKQAKSLQDQVQAYKDLAKARKKAGVDAGLPEGFEQPGKKLKKGEVFVPGFGGIKINSPDFTPGFKGFPSGSPSKGKFSSLSNFGKAYASDIVGDAIPFDFSGGGGGSVSGMAISAGMASFGVPPAFSQPLADMFGSKIDGLGKDLLGGIVPELKNGPGKIIGKLGSVQSILSGDLSGLGSIFTGGFSNLSGIMGGLSGILGGGGIGGIFKKGKKLFGFADGGRPPLGVASLVGEEGPELFVPDTPGTIVPNGGMGGTVVIQKLEIMPGANVDQALVDKPMTFWVDLAQEKILPALNTLGQAGNTTTLNFRGNR
jgi:tape measure domain-containing protein